MSKTTKIPEPSLTVRELFAQEEAAGRGLSMSQVARESGVSYSTLHRHLRLGGPLGTVSARRMQAWDARISASKTLGV